MRVKSLLAPVGLAVMLAIAVPGVSNAMRAGGDDPVEVVDEDPPVVAEDPVEEEAPDEPVVEVEADDEPVIEEEADDDLVVEEEADDEPVVEEEADDDLVVEEEADDEPVDETPIDLFEDEEADDEAAKKPVRTTNRPEKQSGDCDMDSYQSERVSSLDDDEAARGEKVDRNDDGTVCRKELPGQGRGNTGAGSNIKDNKSAK